MTTHFSKSVYPRKLVENALSKAGTVNRNDLFKKERAVTMKVGHLYCTYYCRWELFTPAFFTWTFFILSDGTFNGILPVLLMNLRSFD